MEESLSTNNDNTNSIIEAVEVEQPLFPISSSEEPLQEEIDPDDIIDDLDPTDIIAAEIDVMMAEPEAKAAHIKKKYSKISNEKRMELIDSVENHGQKIKDVASRLEINYSSAKSICQVYKREGRKDKKAFKNRIINDNPNTAQSDLMLNNGPSTSDSQYPVQQSQEIEQENSATPPEKDSLMELRDRLLKSRLGKREELEEGQDALTKEKHTQTYSDGGNNNNFYNAYNNGYSNTNSMQQQQQQYEQSIMNQQRQMFQYNNSSNQGLQQSGSNNMQQQNEQNNKAEQTNTGDNNANRYPQQVYMYTQMPQQQHFVMMSSQPQYQNVYQGYTVNHQQQNQSNMGQYNNSNNNSSNSSNNNNTGQSGSQQNTNVQNFYINDNTTTFYPSQGQGFQMNQGYSQMQTNNNNSNQGQGQGQGQGQNQGQGQFYMTSGPESNSSMQGYQMMQPMMMMVPMNQNNMQQGYFMQSHTMPDNNYHQQQNNNYFLVRGNQNQNQMQQNNSSMQNQQHLTKDIKNESGGKMSSENIEKQ